MEIFSEEKPNKRVATKFLTGRKDELKLENKIGETQIVTKDVKNNYKIYNIINNIQLPNSFKPFTNNSFKIDIKN